MWEKCVRKKAQKFLFFKNTYFSICFYVRRKWDLRHFVRVREKKNMTHNSRGRIDFIYRITIKCSIYFFYIKVDLIFPCVKSGKKCKPLFVCVVCVMEFLLRFNQHRQYYVVSRCRLNGYYWERSTGTLSP